MCEQQKRTLWNEGSTPLMAEMATVMVKAGHELCSKLSWGELRGRVIQGGGNVAGGRYRNIRRELVKRQLHQSGV